MDGGLLGVFDATLDHQNRVVLPLAFAKHLENEFYMAGLPQWRHLVLFPASHWATLLARYQEKMTIFDLEFVKLMPILGAHSSKVTLDKKRRFVIPLNLRSYVASRLVFVGAVDTVRLYRTDRWENERTEGASLELVSFLSDRRSEC